MIVNFLSQEIDESHSCFSMKYLKNKPVRDLKDEQYLKLAMVSHVFRGKG